MQWWFAESALGSLVTLGIPNGNRYGSGLELLREDIHISPRTAWLVDRLFYAEGPPTIFVTAITVSVPPGPPSPLTGC